MLRFAYLTRRVCDKRAHRVVDALRERGLDAKLEKAGVYQYGIAVRLPAGALRSWGQTAPLA
jgi:hypothetical protein